MRRTSLLASVDPNLQMAHGAKHPLCVLNRVSEKLGRFFAILTVVERGEFLAELASIPGGDQDALVIFKLVQLTEDVRGPFVLHRTPWAPKGMRGAIAGAVVPMVRTLAAQAAKQGAQGRGGIRLSSVVRTVRPDKQQLWEIGFHGVLLNPQR